jgi:hypothetical protein
MQNECCSFCKQLGRCPSTNYAMSRKGGVEMGMEVTRSILTPTLFDLKLLVALARVPGKVAFGSGGRVKDFAVGLCNVGRVGINLSKEARIMNNGAGNSKATLAIKCCGIRQGFSLRCYPSRNP